MSKQAAPTEVTEYHYPDPRQPQPLSFLDIRKNTKLVQQALQEVMLKDIDYGTTPGCGDKPGLKKPGSEKLALLFKIALFPAVDDKSENGELRFVVRTKAVHQPTGIELGEGVGAASSLEEKYAWRKAVCKEEFEATPEERRRLKWQEIWANGKKTGKFEAIEQVRQNPANLENTLIKMASKRSKVDVIIQVTAASDIFNQGEDEIIIDESQPRQPKKPKAKPEPKAGQTVAEAQPGEAEAPQTGDKATVPGGFVMIAKRDGICAHCPKETKTGEEIVWDKANKKAYHKDCVA